MRRVLLLALVAVACGGGPEPVVTPPPLHVTAKPPAPTRARWVFSAPEQEIRAKLDLGDRKTLYVGDHGRRELDAGGELQHAATLAEEALCGVLRDDKGRYVFVATDGDTYTSTEPLGPLERVRPPRSEPLESVATGRAAILGISSGALVRSTDWGASWKPVEYPGKSNGHAARVALDTKGNGVLVHFPQRVFVTHDDGATWAAVSSPQYGAANAMRDGSDRLFVFGYHDLRATLAGDKLEGTNDSPAPLFPGHASWQPRTFRFDETERFARMPRPPLPFERSRETLRLLVGDHVVEIASHDQKTQVRSAALGEPLGAPTTHDELGDGIFDASLVASWNGELAYASTDADDDDDDAKAGAKSPTTTIVRSKDFGATWKTEDVLQGTPRQASRAIAMGPRGWTYVGPLCAKRRGGECKPPKIRPAGKQTFDDASTDDDLDLHAFAFDEAHDKVYALADASGGSVLYEGALGGGKLTRTSMLLAARAERVAMTVDDQGALRIFERNGQKVTLHERSAKGEERPARYLDLGLVTIAFAGKRGLAIGDHASYETNDAGETWTRVPSNGSTHGIACSAAGCLLAGAERVGWDLPAVQSTEIVRASTTAPTEQKTKPQARPQVTPAKLACKVSGKGGTVDESGDTWVDGAGAVRWARVSTDFGTGAVTLTYGDKDAFHRAQLFGAPAAGTMETRTGTDVRDSGIVGARYRFARRSATGKLNPVQVELAWWSPSKTQVRRGTLQAVKPFRVSRFTFSGRARVVEGGVLFQGGYGDVLHFVHDDGKSETLGAPPIAFQEAWHSGKRWVLADSDDDVIEMATTDDGGKTWSLHGWAFGPTSNYGDANLETTGDKLVMRTGDAMFDVAWPVASDPPAAIALDATSKDARCDALAVGSVPHQEHIEGSPVTIDLGGAIYGAADRVFHDSATGKLCTSAYLMEQGRDKSAYLYPEKGGGWSGWSYRSTDDKTIVEPFTCK